MVINKNSIYIKDLIFLRAKQLLASQALQRFTELVNSLRKYHKSCKGDHNKPFNY